jgi:hypothetical protein
MHIAVSHPITGAWRTVDELRSGTAHWAAGAPWGIPDDGARQLTLLVCT